MRCCFSVLCASALSGRRGIPPRNMVLYLRSLNFFSTIFLISDCCNSFATLDYNSFTTLNFFFVSSSQIHQFNSYASAEIRRRRCRESEHPPAKIRQHSTRLRELEHQPANLRFQKVPSSWLKPSLSNIQKIKIFAVQGDMKKIHSPDGLLRLLRRPVAVEIPPKKQSNRSRERQTLIPDPHIDILIRRPIF